MLTYYFLTPNLEAPLSLALFFLLRALLKDYVAIFLLFSNATYISFLIPLTLAYGFCGFSF
jgi:hypothetical protein